MAHCASGTTPDLIRGGGAARASVLEAECRHGSPPLALPGEGGVKVDGRSNFGSRRGAEAQSSPSKALDVSQQLPPSGIS